MNAILGPTAVGVSFVALLVRPLPPFFLRYKMTDCHTFICLDLGRNRGCQWVCTGISDAYYCAECTRLEKDRDGCPKIVNLGASRTDLFYERRRLGA